MLKFIHALLLCVPISMLGLDVTINYGKELKEHFSILNIIHKDALACHEEKDTHGVVTHIVCSIDSTPVASFSPTETLFFRFWSRVIDGRFYLYVEPKHKIKLFATPSDLKNDSALITKEQPKKSKSWQIIGYKSEIPFLNEHANTTRLKGLNFPIKIIKNKELFFNDLDIDRGPLRYDDGEDFVAYSHIKALIANQAYIDALKFIDETLIAYPKTIFAKDLLLYRLRALEHFDSVENSDMIIDMGTKWIKKYPTDFAVPEVLYYLGNAYADMKIPDEAKYYFERTISEYPQSRYMPLAKMALAKNFNTGSDANAASKLFAQAYKEAKDLDSASAVAIEWSKFRIQNHDKAQAQQLLETMLKVNPSYITKYPIKSYEFLKLLAEEDMPLIAAQLGEHLYEHLLSEDVSKEDLLDSVSLWYQNAKAPQDAHRINKLFLQEFTHRPKAEEIKDRDDKLLFALAEDESTDSKIQKYDYIIQTYSDTPESDKALLLKAKTLFDDGKYLDVLALYDALTNKDLKDTLRKLPLDLDAVQSSESSPDSEKASQDLIAQSYAALLHQSLEKADCKSVGDFYLKFPSVKVESADEKPLFECLYTLALNKEAAKIAEGKAEAAKDMPTKLEWLYKQTLNFAKLGDDKSVARSGRDTYKLAQSLKATQYYNVGFPLFDTLMRLDDKENALEVYAFLKQNQANNPQMLPLNLTLLKNSESQKDELGIELYAKDILRLQDILHDFSASPYVDFAIIQSYIRTQRLSEALVLIDSLLKKDISNDNKQKALYLKGSVLKTSGQDPKSSFEECLAIPYEGAWKNLCLQGLQILQGQK